MNWHPFLKTEFTINRDFYEAFMEEEMKTKIERKSLRNYYCHLLDIMTMK